MVKSKIDVSQVPDKLSAPWLKKFFLERFGIPVRVTSQKHFLDVWIQSSGGIHEVRYDHAFPFEEFGRLCLEQVYPKSPQLHDHWCGNVRPNSVALHYPEWRNVLLRLVGQEVNAG